MKEHIKIKKLQTYRYHQKLEGVSVFDQLIIPIRFNQTDFSQSILKLSMNFKSNFILVLVLFLVTNYSSYAQDIVIQNNGNEISAKVLEVHPDKVIYKTIDDAKFTMEANDVFMIKYENGSADVFRNGKIVSSLEAKPEIAGSRAKQRVEESLVKKSMTDSTINKGMVKPNATILTTKNSNTKEERLTNESIITLYKKGLSSSIIISKIGQSKADYDLSMEALVRLKDLKVPDTIINAMMEKQTGPGLVQTSNEPGKVAAKTDTLSVKQSGIYYLKMTEGMQELKELEPSVSARLITDSGIGASYTGGAVSIKTRARFDGTMARIQINDGNPVFYFYFDEVGSLSNSKTWFSPSSSPNEFLLVKMTKVKNSREFVTGSYNRWVGNEWGVEEKSRVSFSIEKIQPGVYKVTAKSTLMPGEYCFMYAGNSGQYGMAGQKVFDFGIY